MSTHSELLYLRNCIVYILVTLEDQGYVLISLFSIKKTQTKNTKKQTHPIQSKRINPILNGDQISEELVYGEDSMLP